MSSLRQQFIQYLELKGFSQKTVQNYTHAVIKLSQHYNVSPLELSTQQIKDYFHHIITNKLLSEKSINNHIGALKTFYKFALPDSDIMKDFTSMKVPVKLPAVLTKREMLKLLDAPSNVKHKAVLFLFYATGIRLQECCDLELCDIKREEMLLRIKSGKGKKERYTILSKRLLEILIVYYNTCKPKKYLFEGIYGNKYSKRTVEIIVTRAAQDAGIKKHVTPHTLRHTFATHLHENGVSLQIIQKLLGHSKISTTTIYSHISTQIIRRLINPLDNLLDGGEQE